MEFMKDEYLVSSALLSLSAPLFTWGGRKRRSIEDRLVHTMGTNSKKEKKKNSPVTRISPLTPVLNEAVLIASRKNSSPESSIGNLPICTESSGPKQPTRISKRKTPMKKSGTKLKTPEELKSTPDDSILPDTLLETLISRVSAQMEHISNVDPKILAGQLLESDHHQPPLTVPTLNRGLNTSKEVAALARQKRIQICREKKHNKAQEINRDT